ncbi:hypothetical protein [Listeria seeligeri]|uniref:hypothetical protein n=1 Tax=Listeria seeligeri TaxID=1640 RepID=UPI001629C20F|nr:hypothetical protein [Listeria seeligeri]MBC1723768.1 hypothetical protein [Listeria seeligeri]
MNNFLKKVEKIATYITYNERERRKYARYELEMREFEAFSERELSLRYVNLKARYEFRKNIFSFIVGAILLTVLTGVWKSFYNLSVKSLQLFYTNNASSKEDTLVIIACGFMLFAVIGIILLVVIVIYLKELYLMKRLLLMIEEIRTRNKDA